jgi:hypothetical protein
MPLKRVGAWIAVVIGVAGVIACAAGAVAVGRVAARFDRASDRAFAALDAGAAFAQAQVRAVQQRLQGSADQAERVKEAAREWAAQTTAERLAARLKVDRAAEALAGLLQTAGVWLDSATEATRDLRRLLDLAQLVGTQVDPAMVDDLIGKLAVVRGRLAEVEKTVGEVRDFIDGDPTDDRLRRLTPMLAAAVVAVSEVDDRLAAVDGRLTEVQAATREWQARVGIYITVAAIHCYVLLVWIAAGQVALGRCGWKNCLRPV